MVRGWIAPSDRERALAEHVGERYSPTKRREAKRLLAGAVGAAITISIVAFMVGVALEGAVEEEYAVIWSAPPVIYIGVLDLSDVGWLFLNKSTTFELHLEIPEWDVYQQFALTYFNETILGQRVDFLQMDNPLSGQVVKRESRKEASFRLWIVINSPSEEVKALRFLGGSNSIEGTVSNHHSKDIVVLEKSGGGVSLLDGRIVNVHNEPPLVEDWSLTFSRSRVA